MRGKKGLLDNAYLLYTCLSSIVQDELQSRIRESTVPRVLKTDILGLQIPLPSIEEQKAIAHILGTLDDKIELNRKTNETLEAMAKALFKSWFVDFDPVRAKAEGRPTGLPAEISDLFPDSFEDSELGEIPSGWEVRSIGEVIELAYGKPLKEEQRNGGAYPVFGSNGVVGSHDEYLVEAPGIVVGRKGNPGTVEWSEKNFYPIDTTFFVVSKKEGLGMRFLFYCLKNQNLPDLSADSAVPGLNRNHAYMNNQLLPPVKVASAFERHVEVIFKRKAFLTEEINTLGATRDALLPKLISGEIRIPDAEKMLEEVGV
jgi:type I restriction enzyme S subunit